jgi:hypothetical protein
VNPEKSSLDLNIESVTISPIAMAQLSPQKRKKRRVQLREAQRRRRARLKEESKSFLQIILDQETLHSLRVYSDTEGKPLHICAADLIRGGLYLKPNRGLTAESHVETTLEEDISSPFESKSEHAEVTPFTNEPEKSQTVCEETVQDAPEPVTISSPQPLADQRLEPKNQMELFIE